MSGAPFNTLKVVNHLHLTTTPSTDPILWVRKLRHTEVLLFAQANQPLSAGARVYAPIPSIMIRIKPGK